MISQYSRLCVTAALLEVTVISQYSRLCVTAALLEVTERLQYSRFVLLRLYWR